MPNLESISNDIHYTMFKGDPGTTKSSQAITYPKPQYWFPFDGKMQSLARAMKHHNISGADINYDTYDKIAPAIRKLEAFKLNCPYKTIVIDSITSASDIALRDIRTNKGNSGKGGRDIGGFEVNILEDFNGEASVLGEIASLTKYLFENKGINIILIAHVIRKEQKDASGKVNVVRQIVTAAKAVAQKIPAYCTEIYQFDVNPALTNNGNPEVIIRTQHTSEDYARTSLPLPGEFRLDYDNLYDKWVAPAIDKLKA